MFVGLSVEEIYESFTGAETKNTNPTETKNINPTDTKNINHPVSLPPYPFRDTWTPYVSDYVVPHPQVATTPTEYARYLSQFFYSYVVVHILMPVSDVVG